MKRFPLELGIGARGQETRIMELYRVEKEVSRYLQPSGTNATDTGRQQRPRLRMASRGKNEYILYIHSKSRYTGNTADIGKYHCQFYTKVARADDLSRLAESRASWTYMPRMPQHALEELPSIISKIAHTHKQ